MRLVAVSPADLQKTYFELEKDKLQLQKEKKSAEEKRRAAEHAVKAVRVELARQKEENRKKEIQYAKLLKEKEISDEKRAQAEQYLESLKAHIDSVLHTIDQQKKDADTDEKIIAELTVAMKKLGSKLNLANQKNALNVKQIQTNELIKQGYEDEMMNHKYEEQRLRKRNYLLEKAKEKAAMNATMWQHRCMEAQEGMKLKIMECNELTKALLEERDKLRLQQNLYETVRADRNTFHKQQAQQKDDIAEMKRKAKIAQHQLEQLKEEIQNKDNALINEHFAYKRLLAEMKVAKRKLVKRKQVIATADQVMGSQDAEIRALRQKVTEGEIAQHKQRRAYDDLMQERDILGTQLIRRNDELALLYEKVRVQKSTLEKGEKQYYERLQDLRALKIAINNLKQELQIRTQEVTNIDALRNEIYHVQRELLQERTKVKVQRGAARRGAVFFYYYYFIFYLSCTRKRTQCNAPHRCLRCSGAARPLLTRPSHSLSLSLSPCCVALPFALLPCVPALSRICACLLGWSVRVLSACAVPLLLRGTGTGTTGLERGAREPDERAPVAQAGGQRPAPLRADPEDPDAAEAADRQDRGGGGQGHAARREREALHGHEEPRRATAR